MILVRSVLFNAAFYAWTFALGLLCLPLLALPARWLNPIARPWALSVLSLARKIAGLRYEVRGLGNVPAGPVLIAAKHQSAWDTIVFHALFAAPAYVVKRELLWLPVYGWYVWRLGHIAIDRRAGSRAMRRLLRAAERRSAAGRPIVIFPQGTRVPPLARAAGSARPYEPGVAALYRHLQLPVVPVALNSGLFWPRRSLLRRPGTILIEFLPPISPGAARGVFMAELEETIENATLRLEREAGGA